jgi:hypothetical protein
MNECGTKCPPDCTRCQAFRAADSELTAAEAAAKDETIYILLKIEGAAVLVGRSPFEDFMKVNRFDPHTEKHVRALKPGEAFEDSEWILARVA